MAFAAIERCYVGDNPTDLRCLLNALTVAFPELTTRLSEMDPVPLAHLGTLMLKPGRL